MQSSSEFLLTIGSLLLLGLLTSTLGQRSFLPRVTLLLIFGVIIGKDMLDIIPPLFFDRFRSLLTWRCSWWDFCWEAGLL